MPMSHNLSRARTQELAWDLAQTPALDGGSAGEPPFVSAWKTDNPGTSTSTQITVPTTSAGTYDCVVDWGDDTTSTITTYNDAAWTHTYPVAGTYTVKIYGTFTGINFNNGGDRRKLIGISNWGVLRLGDSGTHFYGCSNLSITATDVLGGITNLSSTFRSSGVTTIPNISDWDVSAVAAFNSMFQGSNFNQAITWTTTAATNMTSMFNGTGFSSQITFSKLATNATSMFQGCASLNTAPIFTDTSSCTTFTSMFQNCTTFNKPLTWTTTAATDMTSMFNGCTAFNSLITFSKLATNATSMFRTCSALNTAPVFDDTSTCTTFTTMFQSAIAFNKPLTWTTTAATNMTFMFNATALNSTITFSKLATNATGMFQNITAFNTAPVFADTSSCTTFTSMFQGSANFNKPLTWTTTSATNMTSMFQSCTNFNSAVTFSKLATNATSMFQSCTNLNTLPAFADTSSTTNMSNMFRSCTAFDQDVSTWSIAALTNATDMFTSSGFSKPNYNLLLDSATGWPSQATIQNNVTFSAGTAHYDGANAIAGKAVLVTTHTWTITDGGTP